MFKELSAAHLSTLSLEPGEVLVVRLPGKHPREIHARVKAAVLDAIGLHQKVLVIDSDISLGVVKIADDQELAA